MRLLEESAGSLITKEEIRRSEKGKEAKQAEIENH